jgi:hypothetical protein
MNVMIHIVNAEKIGVFYNNLWGNHGEGGRAHGRINQNIVGGG